MNISVSPTEMQNRARAERSQAGQAAPKLCNCLCPEGRHCDLSSIKE
jgi:hypothetical protein